MKKRDSAVMGKRVVVEIVIGNLAHFKKEMCKSELKAYLKEQRRYCSNLNYRVIDCSNNRTMIETRYFWQVLELRTWTLEFRALFGRYPSYIDNMNKEKELGIWRVR